MALVLNGKAQQLRREHRDRAWLAWTSAALVRVKKMPKLDKVIGKDGALPQPKRKVERRPWQELFSMAQMWAVASGGTIEE
jgi:hypothetical protein